MEMEIKWRHLCEEAIYLELKISSFCRNTMFIMKLYLQIAMSMKIYFLVSHKWKRTKQDEQKQYAVVVNKVLIAILWRGHLAASSLLSIKLD